MNERLTDGLRPLPLGVQSIGVHEDVTETDLAIAEAEYLHLLNLHPIRSISTIQSPSRGFCRQDERGREDPA